MARATATVNGVDVDTRVGEAYVLSEAKRGAQEALFNAIKDQAENNMKAALRAPEKAELLHQLAEAYRLTAGSPMPNRTAGKDKPAGGRREHEDDAAGPR
jgi:hypothetical protein